MSSIQLAALKERAKRKSLSTPTEVDQPDSECICDRKVTDVLCRCCGHIFVGRVRKNCSIHVNQILLMDSLACPECHTPDSLIEVGGGNISASKQQSDLKIPTALGGHGRTSPLPKIVNRE